MLYMDVWTMDELRRYFLCLDEEENDIGIAGVRWWGWYKNRAILTLQFLTFIMLKGHSEHPASSSPVVLWQAQTLHNLVAPRYHHSSHYLAKPIPFDLCGWCALFTTGRAPTCTSILVKETEDLKGAWVSEWQTKGGWQNEKEAKTEPTTRDV